MWFLAWGQVSLKQVFGHLIAEHFDLESEEPTDIIGVIKWGSNPAVWIRGMVQGESPPHCLESPQ